MSDLVTLRHPKLPAEQVIRIDRRRIGARLAAGWEIVENPAPAKPAANEPKPPAAPPAPEPTESAPKRRGRTNNEEQ